MLNKYFVPETAEEAVQLKSEYGEKGKFLAGGSELNLQGNKVKYEAYIDIRNLNLNAIEKNKNGDIEIGAGITFHELSIDGTIPFQLKRAAEFMSGRNIRNVATIGGNIAIKKSVADLVPTLLVLDAQLKLHREDKLIDLEEYISGKDERLIEKIVIKAENLSKRYGSRIYSRTSSDLSIIGVAVSYILEENIVKDVKIAIGGVAATVKRMREVEDRIQGKVFDAEELMILIKKNVSPISDIRGSKEFKAHLAGELAIECFTMSL